MGKASAFFKEVLEFEEFAKQRAVELYEAKLGVKVNATDIDYYPDYIEVQIVEHSKGKEEDKIRHVCKLGNFELDMSPNGWKFYVEGAVAFREADLDAYAKRQAEAIRQTKQELYEQLAKELGHTIYCK